MSDPNIEVSQVSEGAPVLAAETAGTTGTAQENGAIDPENANKTPEQLLSEVLASPAPQVPDKFTLPSGVAVVMRSGKGRDLLAAQRAAGQDANLVMYALAAALCLYDGKKVVMEDVLEMPLKDVMTIMGKVGGDFLPSTTAQSSTSQP